MPGQTPRSQQHGFTLVELVLATVILGMIGVILAGYLELGLTLRKSNETLRQENINERIGEAMLTWALAEQNSLPPPFTDAPSNRYNAIQTDAPATDAELRLLSLMTSRGVLVNEVNDDGNPAARVRVYQRVADVPVSQPIFGLSGPIVSMAYDVGVIYHTQCFQEDPCNTGATALDPPGDSPALTLANLDVWETAGTDSLPTRINTYPQQYRLLQETADRITILRNQLRTYFNSLQSAASPGSPVNFYPFADLNGDNFPDRRNSGPTAGNQGCHDGWYDLSDPLEGSAILRQLGLTPEEFSVTAFGGPIHLCRDYNPAGSQAEGQLPHNVALRIHATVSDGLAPSINIAENAFFTL